MVFYQILAGSIIYLNNRGYQAFIWSKLVLETGLYLVLFD